MSPTTSRNILITSEHSQFRRSTRRLLIEAGFQNIGEATDGWEALSMLRSTAFGLVISEYRMEPMTGIQLVRQMRADAALQSIPFLIVNNSARAENLIAARESGASGWIVWPFNGVTLRKKVDALLPRAGLGSTKAPQWQG